MIKLIANKASYGFRGTLYAKGDVIEVSEGENYPKEHFDIIGRDPEIKKPDAKKPQTKPEAKTK